MSEPGRGVLQYATDVEGILLIQLPLHRVVNDIFPCLVQFIISADDMFIIIALPDRYAGGGAYYIKGSSKN